MKKHVYALLCAVLCSLLFPSAALSANSGYGLVMDEADLLTDSEEEALSEMLEEISLKQGNDIVVVTVYSLGGKSAESFADDYFDYNGYGQGTAKSGILLLHSPEYRDWWISTSGFCISAFTDDGLDYIGEHITPYLADGEYYSAYTEFAGLCDKFLTQAKTDRPYDRDNLPAEPLSWLWIPGSLAGGLIIALLIVGGMKNQLKSVRFKAEADSYMLKDSLDINVRRDIFLYRTVTRTAKPKNNPPRGGRTHIGSSGSRHGGRGGKY